MNMPGAAQTNDGSGWRAVISGGMQVGKMDGAGARGRWIFSFRMCFILFRVFSREPVKQDGHLLARLITV